jgi:hypothetical protein
LKRFVVAGIYSGSALLVLWQFVAATTFLGDDYLFRAFAQLEANPWVAFVADEHGGEYYRPLPMVVWWLLEHSSGGRAWVFAVFAFFEHATCAVLLTTMACKLGCSRFAAALAGLLFFVAPAECEAAMWFSASTDLLGTAAGLAAVIGFLSTKRSARATSVAFSAAAFLCKETLVILPGLLLAAYWLARSSDSSGSSDSSQLSQSSQLSDNGWRKLGLRRVLPHLGVLAVVLAWRTLVLRGLGGADDTAAPWWGRGMQLVGGLVHSVTAYAPLPEWVAWLAGLSVLLWATLVGKADRRRTIYAWLWVLVALLPLPAAGWVVGARYFYLPAVGLCLLLAIALERTSRLAAGFAVATLLVLGLASGHSRSVEVQLYRKALTAIRAGVADGLGRGYRLFFIGGAIKDLDLALKLDRSMPGSIHEAVIIPDVPASFVWMPVALGQRLDFLLARPPLPPSGAYRFGQAKLMGLARREEAPDLDEVLARLPELRILRLERKGAGFDVVDKTADYRPE